MIYYLLFLTWVSIYCLDDEDFRKHYGLSFHNQCGDYVKSFKCMTTCKMMGFQIFRMNYKCKCSCHEMKTSTVLPYFKWRTNGTTKTVPKTQSPRLYDVVGKYTETETETQTETNVSDADVVVNFTCPTLSYSTSNNTTSNYTTSNYTTTISSDDDRGNATSTADGSTQGGDTNTTPSTTLAAE
ncbi:unnamed protein product [Parnassius mnemosyne]|uniref:Uncharacterized protein n=1 Tax=Parnassius mnemosyne TaxID=213953 RepID=A0AAV1M7U6_9NEOP